MVENKTQPTSADPVAFVTAAQPARRAEDGAVLLELFKRVTGFEPVMWGPSIVGFGRYDYKYDSGHSGRFLATGFSPRKSALTLYIMPGYQDYSEILSRLGKHKLSKSCLYINKLADVDLDVLEELVRTGLKDLGKFAEVKPC